MLTGEIRNQIDRNWGRLHQTRAGQPESSWTIARHARLRRRWRAAVTARRNFAFEIEHVYE